jgi:hypothetical protein
MSTSLQMTRRSEEIASKDRGLLAVEAVACEPVSWYNCLFRRKIQGRWPVFGVWSNSGFQKTSTGPVLEDGFPESANRERFAGNRETAGHIRHFHHLLI